MELASIIYQLSDITTDDQILEGEIRSVIHQTCCFAPNILRDDYVIHFLACRLEHFEKRRRRRWRNGHFCNTPENRENYKPCFDNVWMT